MAVDYKAAGVDIHAGYEAVQRMGKHVKSTYNERVLGGLGSFSGLYSIAGMGLEEPVLVSGTDGVGTKLKLAFALDKHDTIGIDCVAMCVNDIICQGAKPLFFLDYIALGKLFPEKVERIVSGIAEGCRQAECALVGGETAEMPGFYSDGEYDVAGFSVGIVDKKDIITPSRVNIGDVIIGLASSGPHSNGFSLIRKLVGDTEEALSRHVDSIGVLGDALIKPTRIYVRSMLALMKRFNIHGAAHITGGGFQENIPRMLGDGQQAVICDSEREIPPIFRYLGYLAKISDAEAYNTFNMGIGMTVCVAASDADAVVRELAALGETAYILGEVVPGEREAIIV